MKTRLRRLVVALIVVLVSFGAARLAQVLWLQRQSDLRQQALDVLPHVAQYIRDFHRTKVVNGRKVWEVSAREAQYYDEEQLVVVREPAVSFFLDDGREMALRGEEGKVFLLDRDLRRVELAGDIRARFGEYALQTDSAHYDRQTDAVQAPGRVRISGDELDISGDRMTLRVSDQRLVLDGNVKMKLRPNT